MKLTPEEQQIEDAMNSIIRPDETEPDSVRRRRAAVEAAIEAILGETPMEGEMGAAGWYYAGGVSAGLRFVIRRADGVPQFVATAPCSYDESQAYVNYTLLIQRNLDGVPTAVSFELDHHQQYNNQYATEQYNIPLPKPLRGELTEVGKKAAKLMAEKFPAKLWKR